MTNRPRHDWYFHEWVQTLGVRFPHAWLQKEVGYSDGKSSNILTGKKRYDRDLVNEIADAMRIQPYELLMHPEDAMRLRRLQGVIADVAAERPAEAPAPAEPLRREAS